MNATVYRRVPGAITVAEESTAWPGVTRPTHLGGLGFGFKWNMGWMHDTLDYVAKEPIYRQWHHHQMTFSMMYAFTENFVLPLSHDEVVHGKGSLLGKIPGDHWQQAATLRALYAYMWAHPGKQLLFMGGEFGQGAEWSDSRGLDWWLLEDPLHSGLQRLVGDLNRVYRAAPGAVDAGHLAGRVLLDRRERRGQQRVLLPALGRRRHGARLRGQLLRPAAGRLPAGAPPAGPLGRGGEHRLGALRRVRRRQLRVGDRGGAAVARAAGVRVAAGAAAGCALAATLRRSRWTTPAQP